MLLLFNTTRTTSGPPSTRASIAMDGGHDGGFFVLVLFNTTRTTSGPPSTRAAIAMDGGVADTQPAILHRPLVGGGSRGGGAASVPPPSMDRVKN